MNRNETTQTCFRRVQRGSVLLSKIECNQLIWKYAWTPLDILYHETSVSFRCTPISSCRGGGVGHTLRRLAPRKWPRKQAGLRLSPLKVHWQNRAASLWASASRAGWSVAHPRGEAVHLLSSCTRTPLCCAQPAQTLTAPAPSRPSDLSTRST